MALNPKRVGKSGPFQNISNDNTDCSQMNSNEDDNTNDHLESGGSEQTGRWTRAEHELFLKALELYGKEWKKVAGMVKTRTVVQTRTHAQKYFLKKKAMQDDHHQITDYVPMATVEEDVSKLKRNSSHYLNSDLVKRNKALTTHDFDSPPQHAFKNMNLQLTNSMDYLAKHESSELPSPPAIGKRRNTEIEVAQTLASSVAPVDEIANILSNFKTEPVSRSSEYLSIQTNSNHVSSNHSSTWEEDLLNLQLNPIRAETAEVLERIRECCLAKNNALRDLLDELLVKYNGVNSTLNLPTILNTHQASGSTLLVELCEDCCRHNLNESDLLELIPVLLNNGASIKSVDKEGRTCLHHLARLGFVALGRYIIARGVNINQIDKNGELALHYASKYCQLQFAEMLIEFGSLSHIHNRDGLSVVDIAGICVNDIAATQSLRLKLFETDSRLRTLVLYYDTSVATKSGELCYWDRHDRLTNLIERVISSSLYTNHEVELSMHSDQINIKQLLAVHSKQYILEMSKQCELNKNNFSSDVMLLSRECASIVVHAVSSVLSGRAKNAFCVLNAPSNLVGHNESWYGNQPCSIFNNCMIGALSALESPGCQRVAIIDFSTRRGIGTEHILNHLRQPSKLFYFSLNVGEESCDNLLQQQQHMANNCFNVTLPPLWRQGNEPQGRIQYREAITCRLLPSLRSFCPSLIIVSLGLDAIQHDIGNQQYHNNVIENGMDLTSEDIKWITSEVSRVANICCHGRIVSILETGFGKLNEDDVKSLPSDNIDISTATLDVSSSVDAALAHITRLVYPFDEIH